MTEKRKLQKAEYEAVKALIIRNNKGEKLSFAERNKLNMYFKKRRKNENQN